MVTYSRGYREAGEQSTRKAIGFRNQEIVDFQGSRFSEVCRPKPDEGNFTSVLRL